MGSSSFSDLVDEISSLAKDSETQTETFNEFSIFVDKLSPILVELEENKLLEKPPIRKAMKSLEKELEQAKCVIVNPNYGPSKLKQIEDVTQNLGRSLGLMLFSCRDVSMNGKEKIEALRIEMMNVKFSTVSSDNKSEVFYDDIVETEEDTEEELVVEDEIVEEKEISLSIDDVVLQLKYGGDEEFKCALSDFNAFISENIVTEEWISEEGIIPILFNRLGTSKEKNRFTIIQILRNLTSLNPENKEKMADVGYLSTLVKSLSRDMEEQREAVGLLLTLSDVSSVRRRIGRIRGCIVMLVAISNGEQQGASRDAAELLNALSSNTQNALLMAEAGYFKPLVQYLKEGSDMSKILMATTLSRMELRDQTRSSIGKDGAIEPLVEMFKEGKLEAKLSALNALQNLSTLKENTERLISSGIVFHLLQQLFSVTSVLMTLREPASAILAQIAQSESVLVNRDVALQILSLLNVCSPIIQCHLLQALNNITSHSNASKVRKKMMEKGAVQLLLPFLTETNNKIRTLALKSIYTLSKDLPDELREHVGEHHFGIIVNIISSSISEAEKSAAIGILSNLPVGDEKATDILKRANLVPILVSIMNSIPGIQSPTTVLLAESIAGVLIRFTVPSNKSLQQYSAENGVIPVLVNLLSNGSLIAKCRAATSLTQLSNNSLSLSKLKKSKWLCMPPSVDALCEVHDGYCFPKSTFCLIKAGAALPLVKILEGDDRGADEAILDALATLLQNEIWENGCNYIAKLSGVEAIVNIVEQGSVVAQEKAIWILDRIFRVEALRVRYGESAQMVLIDIAQKGDQRLKPAAAKLLAQLELLQEQSSYFGGYISH